MKCTCNGEVGKLFPITIVAVNGDQVVLSQGGKSVREGERYSAVMLGTELKDPQTGRSLGRMESTCCTIRIDRVSDQTSYGTIEGNVPAALAAFKPGMVELRGLAATAAEPNDAATASAAAETTDQRPARTVRTASAKPAAEAPKEDENW